MKRSRVVIPEGGETDALPVSAPAVAIPPIRTTRKPTKLDFLRIGEIERLRREGTPLLDAVWAVIGENPDLRYSRFEGAARPSDVVLRSKFNALLARTNADAIEAAKRGAMASFAGAAEGAATTLAGLATGQRKIADPHAERIRLDAAKTVTEAVGIGARSGGTTAVQVNVFASIAEKLRAARTPPAP